MCQVIMKPKTWNEYIRGNVEVEYIVDKIIMRIILYNII